MRASDGQHPVDDDESSVVAQHVPASGQRRYARWQDHERADREAEEHDGARAPSGVEEPTGERPGQTERERRPDGKR